MFLFLLYKDIFLLYKDKHISIFDKDSASLLVNVY